MTAAPEREGRPLKELARRAGRKIKRFRPKVMKERRMGDEARTRLCNRFGGAGSLATQAHYPVLSKH